VIVPETRGSEYGRTLKLGFMRVKSESDEARSPLFILAGGPGQTAVSTDFLTLLKPQLLGQILADRDIVLLEQRGTRNTSVHLDCPELTRSDWTTYEKGMTEAEAELFQIGVFKSCIDSFESQGVNLNAYNSVENAADVDAVREALGYERFIYYGASYGSQLGQHVMRDFPGTVEAVILDGANSLSRKSWVEDRALDAQWGINNLTKLCDEDRICRENLDIPGLVEAALALFDKGPLPFRYSDPADPALTVEGKLTTDDMVSLIYEMQGSVIGAFSLPATLQVLSSGDVEQAVEILGQRRGSALVASRNAPAETGMAMLMHTAMVCSDDPVHSTSDVITKGTGRYATAFGKSIAEQYVAMCSVLDIQELPDSTDVDVSVDVPVLLLSGSLDVATPAFRSQIVADALPNATHLIFPGRTHVQLSSVNLCAFDIMAQFTRNPDASLDTRCMENATAMGFVLPDGTMSTDQGGSAVTQ
jgi:pimeloyl-ACP methyl ester carboxylesterase